MSPTVRPVGDRAALIELPDNDAAVRVARALAGRRDLEDVVPGHCTVLVTWPAGAALPGDLDPVTYQAPAARPGREREIPVIYDGADLDEVALLTGLSPQAVIERHVASDYVVGFLGFAPGFAYLLAGDERLHVPRLARPRERVPAGSVAIAGPYSGIYPRESPGGWRLLGTTAASMFDAAREPPALLAPGDRVRFVAV